MKIIKISETATNTLTYNYKHPFKVEIAPYAFLNFTNMITGCNIMQMEGGNRLCPLKGDDLDKLINFFNTEVKDHLRSHSYEGNYGVGIVVYNTNSIYYQNHPSFKEFMDKVGFVKVAESIRYAHDGYGTQDLFALTL